MTRANSRVLTYVKYVLYNSEYICASLKQAIAICEMKSRKVSILHIAARVHAALSLPI